jgi:hypothetical protein
MLAAGFVVAFVAAFAFGALWRRAISARELAIERAEYAEALRVRVLFRGLTLYDSSPLTSHALGDASWAVGPSRVRIEACKLRGVPMLVLSITPSSSRRSGSGQSPGGEADQGAG